MENPLKKYQLKRNFSKTKEPIGSVSKTHKKLRFAVQHHIARKDHYDFRLEWKGTLKSWAVPKGPSYNFQDKRLAIMVEDHPLSYQNFEGTIPKGEYGGGTVMLWDEGYYEIIGDFHHGFQDGILKFYLHGKRLKGAWSLIRFKEEHWILVKEKDHYQGFQNINEYQTSIKTGRTMTEIENQSKKTNLTSRAKGIVSGITITHPSKIIFPKEKITKLDIALYYHKVYPRMAPFLNDRIVSTIRTPEGILKTRFFKKHFDNSNIGIGKKVLSSKNHKRDDYYYIKSEEGLISEVQQNSFEYHVWGSNVQYLEKPNIMIFDLDPDDNMKIQQIRQGVLDLKSILDELSLISFLKTSGGKGYHVVVPIYSLTNWHDFREFSQNIAKIMEMKWPDKYTSNIRKKNRKGKIFIDWIRNTRGSTSVAPYSIRLRDKASVSMPISWSELNKIRPNEITLDLAIKRLKRKDPWAHFFDVSQ